MFMALNHDVYLDQDKQLVASSSEEQKILELCDRFDFKLNEVNLVESFIQVGGEKYHIPVTIPFNSNRKRMAVFVQFRQNYFMIEKGADEVISQFLSGEGGHSEFF